MTVPIKFTDLNGNTHYYHRVDMAAAQAVADRLRCMGYSVTILYGE